MIKPLSLSHTTELKLKALTWADKHFETVCYLDSNQYNDYQYPSYESLIAFGNLKQISCPAGNAFETLKDFHDETKSWLFGFLGYDLKNEIENLTSENIDRVGMPDLYFFQPEHVFTIRNEELIPLISSKETEEIIESIENFNIELSVLSFTSFFQNRIDKSDYLNKIHEVKKHINQGDVYELNICQEFFAEKCRINPVQVFRSLSQISKAPFSAYFKHDNQYLVSASPERFLKRSGQKIISQPIKGTIHRSSIDIEDIFLKERLLNDAKERAENVMIVDLVRNDLSRSCYAGSVEVEELFGVKTFEQVHQLVSTITGTVKENVHFVDVIKNAFPMGSMTGAPKVKAMQLIEQYEESKRGLYSGSVGYITPDTDFDFNVVIRSLLYNADDNYLSYHVGSAITTNSNPEKEYQECLLKAKGFQEVFKSGKKEEMIAL